MSALPPLPRATRPFVQFSQILRSHGFAVSPEQTVSYIEAIGLLGPRHIFDIRSAGLAMLAIPRERQGEYDALFRAFFMGQTIAAPTSSEDGDELEAHEEQAGEREVELADDEQEAGGEASQTEALLQRSFSPADDDQILRQFTRHAADAFPRRRSRRWQTARSGRGFDLRGSLREAVRNDGELVQLRRLRRKSRQRPIALLIDVSGSMQEQSEQTLRFAHAVKLAGERVEVFTFGTRLTRITRSLADRNVERALEKVSRLVADFDGGTRIGDALDALLSVPRFAGALRGASVIVVSDGLERGDPATMIDAVQRLSRLVWRLDWLTPLAADEGYVPRTEALAAILPWLDSLASGATLAALCEHVLGMQARHLNPVHLSINRLADRRVA